MGLLRRLFGAKKSSSPPSKRRWSFSRSSSPSSRSNKPEDSASICEDSLDANKRAIAVAAATAAVAEAALAAAQAAAEVVRLTTAQGSSLQAANTAPRRWLEEFAAVKIQSAFRGYLARRALRALKALVKLQALVRGHIVRKQTADMLRRMQTLVRLQARARATRSCSQVSDSWQSSSSSNYSRHVAPSSPHKDRLYRAYSTKYDGPSVLKRCGSNTNFRGNVDADGAKFGSLWLERWMVESMRNNHGSKLPRNRHADDEGNDKILEVDTWKPRMKSEKNSKTFKIPQHVSASDDANQNFMSFDYPSKLSTKELNPTPSAPSGEGLSFNSLKQSHGKEEAVHRTAENSPRALSVSSRPGSSSGRRAPFTPTRSECSWGHLNGYEGFPNYMCNTESSRAKARSQSAPRQRLEFDKYGLSKRSLLSLYEGDAISERSSPHQNDYMHKAYPASGRLSRIGSSNLG